MNEKELFVTYSQGVLAIDGEKKSEEEQLPEQMKELMKMNIKTVIKLPRAIKQSTGSNIVLSDNKKEATFFKNVDLTTKFTGTDFDERRN